MEGFVGGPSESGGLGAWILRRESKPENRDRMDDLLGPIGYVWSEQFGAAGKDVFWKPQGPLNQGQTSQCVPHAGRNLELATPNPAQWLTTDEQVPDGTANMLYPLAQSYDGIPLPHAGTTVHGLYTAMQKLNAVAGDPVWASSPDDVLAWVRTRGPVIFASVWYQQMNQVDAHGYVYPGGAVEGGHCYLLFGANSSDEVFCWQPWGSAWGASLSNVMDQATGETFSLPSGVFKLNRAGLTSLFADGHAEGVAPSKTPPAPQPTPQPVPDWKKYPWWEGAGTETLLRRTAGSYGYGGNWKTYGWLEQHSGNEWTWHPPGQ